VEWLHAIALPPVIPIPPPITAPEPSTWAMMLVGFAGIGFLGYRRALGTA
jgi:hypothetical protein